MVSLTLLQEPLGHSRKTLGRWVLDAWRVVYLGALILVLVLSPSSYGRTHRLAMSRHMVLNTAPILLWFTVMCALFSLVLTRIVITTALSYGLSQYALQLVIRVLVLELIPLCAALFVALRCTLPDGAEVARMQRQGYLDGHGQRDADPIRREVLPRVVAGIFSTVTLAALSCVVALVLAYLGVNGLSLSGLAVYTRQFGLVFSPAVTLIFVLKTLFFSLAVSLMPMASALYGLGDSGTRTHAQVRGLVRMFVVILLIEVVCLLGNYY